MSWIYGYIAKRAGVSDFRTLRPALHSFTAPQIGVWAGGTGRNMQHFAHPQNADEQVFVLGEVILPKGDDFVYPDAADWQNILQDEGKLPLLDGHWLILIASPSGVRAYNDPLCQRTLFAHETEDRVFFCSEISLLKEAGLAELDAERFGVYWHSKFPPHLRKFAPGSQSFYRDVCMLYQGGMMRLSASGIEISERPFLPDPIKRDLHKLLENMTLLPLKAGRKVCVGLSGGMDVRPLLAILLKSGFPFSTVHFGVQSTWDYRIAERIARDHKLPFRFISHQEAGTNWDSARSYLHHRGFGYNPASSCLMCYYPMLWDEADVFLNGCYGEIFRVRSMAAHAQSLLKPRGLDYQAFASYLFMQPQSFFTRDIEQEMRQGFWHSLKDAVSLMPDSRSMPNPLWMDLFYVRYSLRSIHMPDLSNLDRYITDHMPFQQGSLISQHWHYGLWAQLGEKVHRRAIRDNAPSLEKYPLAIAEVKAPYLTPSFALKVLVAAKRLKRKVHTATITRQFLRDNQDHIMDLMQDSKIAQDPWIERQKLSAIVKGYYGGDMSQQNALLSFISYALGK